MILLKRERTSHDKYILPKNVLYVKLAVPNETNTKNVILHECEKKSQTHFIRKVFFFFNGPSSYGYVVVQILILYLALNCNNSGVNSFIQKKGR